MAVQTRVKIDSTDRSTYLVAYKAPEEWGEFINSAAIDLKQTILTATTLVVGQKITIERGTASVSTYMPFRGYIRKIEEKGGIVTLTCDNRMYETQKAKVTKSYDKNIDTEAGVGSDILINLITENTGLTADTSSVEATPSTLILDKFVLNNETVFDGIKRIQNIYGYSTRYDALTDTVFSAPKGFTTYGTNLLTGTNITNRPIWNTDLSQIINHVKVYGASGTDETTQPFDGDGAETQFTLTNTPGSTEIFVGGVKQLRGIVGVSTTFDYSVDVENKQVNFESGSIPGAGSGNVVVKYDAVIPIPIVVKNLTSIALYGGEDSTPFKEVLDKQEFKSIGDAEAFGEAHLIKFSTPFVSTKLTVDSALDLNVGNTVAVTDSINNKSGTFFVTKIERIWPYRGDIVHIGDRPLRLEDWMYDTNQTIAKIQEELRNNQDILVEIFDFVRDIPYKRRWFKKIGRTLTLNSSFILGHARSGILGTSQLGAAGVSAESTTQILHPDNIAEEYIYDNDFKDTGNTTATWDNSAFQWDFTGSQVIQTSSIHLGGATATTGRITFPTANITNPGNVTYELTADGGSNWEPISLNTIHTFTNTGTDMRARATSSGNATIDILSGGVKTPIKIEKNP